LEALKTAGMKAEQRGNRLYVRRQDRDRALMRLNEAEALPKDTSIGFAEMLGSENPFRSTAEDEWRRRVALGGELGRIIAAAPDIERARVVLQDKSKRRIGAAGDIKPTASVVLRVGKGKVLNQEMVDGLCRFVSGAVPGLAPSDVTVLDESTLRGWSVPRPEDALGAGLLQERKKNEQHLTERLVESLQWIPGVVVSVSVELDASKSTTQKNGWAKPEVKSDETSSTSTDSGSNSGETGVNPNVGTAIAGGGSGTRSETEEGKTEFFDAKPTEVTHVEKAPYGVKRATASVQVPHSFLVGVYRARYPDADPKASGLEENENFRKVKDEQVAQVRSAAKTILQSKDDDVMVAVYYDFTEDSPELKGLPIGVAEASPPGAMSYVRQYGMQGGLVVLSLFSFLMMARMVRKSAGVAKTHLPARRTAAEDMDVEEPLQVSSDLAGRAGASEGVLVGQEVDDDTLRATQMTDQLSGMVDKDPQAVAELIRRWAATTDK
jgi:flagellar M-ring protein FliF